MEPSRPTTRTACTKSSRGVVDKATHATYIIALEVLREKDRHLFSRSQKQYQMDADARTKDYETAARAGGSGTSRLLKLFGKQDQNLSQNGGAVRCSRKAGIFKALRLWQPSVFSEKLTNTSTANYYHSASTVEHGQRRRCLRLVRLASRPRS